eukprot:jgi/Orpsp1_1/1181700/evm.model.c7180000078247.1
MATPYKNSENITKKLISDTGDDYKNSTFILMLNNFKDNIRYIKTENLDDNLQLESELVKGIFQGLKINNKLYYPLIEKTKGNGKSKPTEGLKYVMNSRRNLTQLYDSCLSNDTHCEKSKTGNLLYSILHWRNTLISNKYNKKFMFPKKDRHRRMIAFGDIHGDYDKLVKLLRHVKIIDKNNNWIGKDTILVQT